MAKKVTALIKLQVNAGKATPAPPKKHKKATHSARIAAFIPIRFTKIFLPQCFRAYSLPPRAARVNRFYRPLVQKNVHSCRNP